VVTIGVLLTAHPASAQWGREPIRGEATGHIGVASGNDGRGSTLSVGGSVAVIEKTGWGAEFDAGFANDDDGRTGGLDVQSYMVNVIGMLPRGKVRPFVTAGAGGLRLHQCISGCAETLAWTDWGFTGGGGVQVRFHPLAAIRADVRYFTALADHPDPDRPENFSFWRFSVGATFIWHIVD
jgi:opacity protein-like surface antigen